MRSQIIYLDEPIMNRDIFEHYIPSTDDNTLVRYIYTHLTPINYSDYPALELILCPCTGIEHLKPIPDGIKLIHLDDGKWLYDHALSTVEYNIYAMLRLMFYHRDQLAGSNVGFIGYGRVGQKINSLLSGFDIDTYYFDLVEPKYYKNPDAIRTSVNRIFDICDVISIQLSENDSTKNFINCEHFNIIRNRLRNDGVYGAKPYFINTARSSIVNGKDLLDAIDDDLFAGVLLDVTESYPKDLISKLNDIKNTNVVLSGHIAGKGHHSRLATDAFIMRKFRNYLLKKGDEKAWEM